MPQAAFTVKHEAVSYIENELKTLESVCKGHGIIYKLYGGPDGEARGWTEIYEYSN